MVEIFNYTERVVNMVRPRKLLFMAIGEEVYSIVVGLSLMFCRWCCSSSKNESTAVASFSFVSRGEGKGRGP